VFVPPKKTKRSRRDGLEGAFYSSTIDEDVETEVQSDVNSPEFIL
jgi:hypothetical protein